MTFALLARHLEYFHSSLTTTVQVLSHPQTAVHKLLKNPKKLAKSVGYLNLLMS